MTANGGATYSYDAENRMVSNPGAAYVYDGDGNRVKKVGSTTTLYWYGATDDILTETDASGGTGNDYIFFGGKRVARRDSSGTVHYYFSDHLGSTSLITDVNGTMSPQAESDFYPYGGEIVIVPDSTNNHYKFTGKERDAETCGTMCLDNFGARYDSSSLGRFMTPDWDVKPVTVPYAKFGDPQTLNLYAYVENAPINAADADGHEDCTGNNWLACHAPKVAAAVEDAEQSWTGTIGKLGSATDQLESAAKGGATSAGHKVANGIGKASDFLNDHPVLTLALTLGMSAEKDGPALEDSLEDAGSSIEEEAQKAGSALSRLSLSKSLASEQQVSEISSGGGTAIAGAGQRRAIDDIARLTSQYGGTAKDWVKVASSNFKAADGTSFETHAYKNITTGQIVEYKTKPSGLQ